MAASRFSRYVVKVALDQYGVPLAPVILCCRMRLPRRSVMTSAVPQSRRNLASENACLAAPSPASPASKPPTHQPLIAAHTWTLI